MKLLKVSFTPSIMAEDTTRTIMSDILIALAPAFIWGLYIFGMRVMSICALSVLSAVIFEYISCKIFKRQNSIGDLSACVSGIIFAFLLPVGVPFWIVILGNFISIVIIKGLFGGLGKNLVNPSLGAYVIFLLIFHKTVTAYTAPFEKLPVFDFAVSGFDKTPSSLEYLASGYMPKGTLFDLMIGNTSGAIGEVSALLLIAGGIYLLVRRITTLHIPVAFIATVAVITYIFPKSDMSLEFMLCHLFSGSLMLGAFFMACDFSTSPMTPMGKIIYGVGCGLLTVIFRYIGIFAEGVPFAIVIMNFTARCLDGITRPKIKKVANNPMEE